MEPRRIEILPSFEEAYHSLDQKLQGKVRNALILFSERSADHVLRPELKNGLDNVWSIRITKGYRAFYKKIRESGGAIYCMFHIGRHDDYRILKQLSKRFHIVVEMRNKSNKANG